MKKKIEAVKAFHTAFKIGHRETPKADLGLAKKAILKKPLLGYLLIFIIGIYSGIYDAMYSTFISYVLIIFFGLTLPRLSFFFA